VIKINDKKKEEFKLLEDFFSDYYKSFHEHLFPENYQLDCSESPDFIIKFDNQKIGIEITEAIKEEMMKSLDSKIEIYKIVIPLSQLNFLLQAEYNPLYHRHQ